MKVTALLHLLNLHHSDGRICCLFFWQFGISNILINVVPILYIFIYLAQDRFLAYSPEQHPIVLQIGGSNLENLAKATQLANTYGYDEINFKFV